MRLRPYQIDLIDQTRSLMEQGCHSILLQSPTGSGKTALTANMLGTARQKQMASLFTVHRRELVKQSIRAFHDAGVPLGIVAAGFQPDPRHLVQLGSIGTLARRSGYFRKPPSLVIWDECHHIAAKSWSDIRARFPDAYHIGLTATPVRLDGKGLRPFFQEMINGPAVRWLIDNKYLSDYVLFAPGSASLQGVSMRAGDFVKSELSAAVDKPTITGNAITHYQRYAMGKRAVVFCASIEHSRHVVAQFNQAGIPAEHVDGETDVDTRDQAIKRFERGETLALSNVDLFGEGFDLPAIEVMVGLRPTNSLGLYLQQVGRVLRPFPGKQKAIILDHAGNAERHGLPCEERTWNLDGRSWLSHASKEDSGKSIRICPRCFAANRSGYPVCDHCGTAFEIKAREIEEREGELQEIDLEAVRARKKQEQYTAETKEDLIALGKTRGYRNPYQWAHMVMQKRQAAKLKKGRAS